MRAQRINRIKDIIRSADAELMEARARVYPVEYAEALAELENEEAEKASADGEEDNN